MYTTATKRNGSPLSDEPPGTDSGDTRAEIRAGRPDVSGLLVHVDATATNAAAQPAQARIDSGDALARQLLLAGVPVAQVEAAMRRFEAAASRGRPLTALVRRIDSEVGQFHSRRLHPGVRFLALAGTPVWIRGTADVESWHLLSACGTTFAGRRRLIDFRLVRHENVSSWAAFLAMLEKRGLPCRDLELVTADAHGPVRAALDVVWPGTRIQHCWSSTLLHLRLMQREYGPTTCIKELAEVMCARNVPAALAALARWTRAWRLEAPAAVDYVRRNTDGHGAFVDYPGRWREDIQSVEPARRLLQGVRARGNPRMTFESSASCARVVYGLALSSNDDRGAGAVDFATWTPAPAPEVVDSARHTVG